MKRSKKLKLNCCKKNKLKLIKNNFFDNTTIFCFYGCRQFGAVFDDAMKVLIFNIWYLIFVKNNDLLNDCNEKKVEIFTIQGGHDFFHLLEN